MWPLEKDEAFNKQPSDGGRRPVECGAGRAARGLLGVGAESRGPGGRERGRGR